MSESPPALQKDELWKLLVETVHALPMFKNHKRFVQDVMIKEKPDISAKELAVQINIPLGEAIVLLDEIRGTKPVQTTTESAASPQKPKDRTLFDFGA